MLEKIMEKKLNSTTPKLIGNPKSRKVQDKNGKY